MLNEQESQKRLPSAATPQLRSITDAVLKRVLLSSPHFSRDVEHQGVSLNWINNVEKMGWSSELRLRLFTLSSSVHRPFVGHSVLRRGTPWEYTFLGALLPVGKPDSAYSLSGK